MTLLKSVNYTSNISYAYIFGLLNPTIGSNNIVVSNVSTGFSGFGLSYTGVKQSGLPDASNSFANTGTSTNLTLNVIANNCWIIGMGGAYDNADPNSTMSLSVLTQRSTNNRHGGSGLPFMINIWDSNGAVGSGNNTIGFTSNIGNAGSEGILLSLAPASANLDNSLFFGY